MTSPARVVPLKGEQVKVGAAIVKEAPTSIARQAAVRDLRLRELSRVIRGRHGAGPINDPSIALDYAVFAAHHLQEPNAIARWIDLNTPCLPPGLRDEIVRAAVHEPRKWKAAQAGQFLKLTYDERCAWGITTIRASDLTRTEHQIFKGLRKRERDRVKAEARRREDGAVPRARYLQMATSTSALASQVGVSARTLRARREEIELLKILQGFVAPQLYKILEFDGPRQNYTPERLSACLVTFQSMPRGSPMTIDANELAPISKRVARAYMDYARAKMHLSDLLAEEIEQKERDLYAPPKKRGRKPKAVNE